MSNPSDSSDRPKKKHRLSMNLFAAGPPDDPTVFLQPADGAPPDAQKIVHRLGKPEWRLPPEEDKGDGH